MRKSAQTLNVPAKGPDLSASADAWTTERVFPKLRNVSAAACYSRSNVGKFPVTSSVTADYARLLSLAVHEFRTPASVVGGYLRMLQRDTDPALSDRQRKMVDEADKAYARIVALVNELSDVSKIDGGDAAFKDEPLDLFQLISDVATDMHEAEDREVHCSYTAYPLAHP